MTPLLSFWVHGSSCCSCRYIMVDNYFSDNPNRIQGELWTLFQCSSKQVQTFNNTDKSISLTFSCLFFCFFNGCQSSLANNNGKKTPKHLGFRPTVYLLGPGPQSLSRAVDLGIFGSAHRKVTVNALQNIQIGYFCYVSVHAGMCVSALLLWYVWCVGPGNLEMDRAWMVLVTENAKIWKTTKKTTEATIPKGTEKKKPSLFCLSLLLTRVATPHIVPSGNTWSGQSWSFHFTAHSLRCNIPDLLMVWCLRFTAIFRQLKLAFSRSTTWMNELLNAPHVLTWPLRLHVIRLQGAQSWCNYTSFELFMPWKIFTQVSHNHSGPAVDTELHAARHTPAVG